MNFEIAATPEKRNKGFQELDCDALLIVFENEAIQGISMQNVPHTLDIHFYNSDGELTKKKTRVSEGKLFSDQPVKYVLETKTYQ